MLGKLTKYELKSTARTFLPLYAIMLAIAVIMRLFFHYDTSGSHTIYNTIANIMMITYTSIIIATFVITILMLIQRFNKNLLGDEGYLMHTLPVKTWHHIGSKLLGAIIWIILSSIVIILSASILIVDANILNSIKEFFSSTLAELLGKIGISGVGIFIEVLLVLFTQLIATILLIYTAIAIGSLYNKNRIAASILAFIAIFFVLNILVNIIVSVVGYTPINNFFNSLNNEVVVHSILIGGICINLILSTVYFTVTNYILKKKLNLQ